MTQLKNMVAWLFMMIHVTLISCVAGIPRATSSPISLMPRQESTSSYNYWWPYPPGGVYATTSNYVTTTSIAPTYTSASANADQESQDPSSEPLYDSTNSNSSTSSTSIPLPSSNSPSISSSYPIIRITAPTLVSATTSPNNPAPKTKFQVLYLVPLFVLAGLGVGVGVALLLYSRCGRTSDGGYEKGFEHAKMINRRGDLEHQTDRPWRWAFGKSRNQRHEQPVSVNEIDTWHDPPPSTSGWYIDSSDEEDITSVPFPRNRQNIEVTSPPPDQVAAPTPRGWKRYHTEDDLPSSSHATPSIRPTSRSSPTSDKFTSLPIRHKSTLSEVSSIDTPLHSGSLSGPAPNLRYSLLRLPFTNRRGSPSQKSVQDSGAWAVATSSTPQGYRVTNGEVRRTSAGRRKKTFTPTAMRGLSKHCRERENSGHVEEDEEELLSHLQPPYQSHVLEGYGSPPPTEGQGLFNDELSSDDNESDHLDAQFPTTPRDENGEIRHKSIRRVLATRIHGDDYDMVAMCPVQPQDSTLSSPVDDDDPPSFYPTPLPDINDDPDLVSLDNYSPTSGLRHTRPTSYISVRKGAKPVHELVSKYGGTSSIVSFAAPSALSPSSAQASARHTRGLSRQLVQETGPSGVYTTTGSQSSSSKTAPQTPCARSSDKPRKLDSTLGQKFKAAYSSQISDSNARSITSLPGDPKGRESSRRRPADGCFDPYSPVLFSGSSNNTKAQEEYPALRVRSPIPDPPDAILSPPLQPHLFFAQSQFETRKLKNPVRASRASPYASRSGKISHPDRGPLPRKLARRTRASPLKSEMTATIHPQGETSPSLSYASDTMTPPTSHFSTRARETALSRVESIVKRSYSARDMDDMPSSPTGFGAWDSSQNLHSNLNELMGFGDNLDNGTSQDGSNSKEFTGVPLSPIGDTYTQFAGGIEHRLALLHRLETE